MKTSTTALPMGVIFLAAVSIAVAQSTEAGKGQVHREFSFGTTNLEDVMHFSTGPGQDIQIAIKDIKGAPYGAETRSETIQTLADGNRIIRRNTARIYRDSEGRTRQEYSFRPDGTSATADLISINDPVAGVAYTLHPTTKTAEKITMSGDPFIFNRVTAGPGDKKTTENRVFMYRTTGSPPEPGLPSLVAETGRSMTIRVPSPQDENQPAVTTESLGTRIMLGVEVEGKRTTSTLPAGAIGNEQPLVTVTETWYSPELQTTIYSKRQDPMAGTTVFEVTKLDRGEPDPSLFQVPPDFSVDAAKYNIIRKIEKPPKE